MCWIEIWFKTVDLTVTKWNIKVLYGHYLCNYKCDIRKIFPFEENVLGSECKCLKKNLNVPIIFEDNDDEINLENLYEDEEELNEKINISII